MFPIDYSYEMTALPVISIRAPRTGKVQFLAPFTGQANTGQASTIRFQTYANRERTAFDTCCPCVSFFWCKSALRVCLCTANWGILVRLWPSCVSVQSWFLKESKQIVVFADLNFRTLQVPFFDMAFELGLCKILKEAYFELKLKKQVCAFLLTRYPHQRLCNDTHEDSNCVSP